MRSRFPWNQRAGRRGKAINRKATRPLNFLLNHRISPPPPSFSPQRRRNNRLIWHWWKTTRFLCPSRKSDYYISRIRGRKLLLKTLIVSRRYAIKLDTKEMVNFHVNVFHPETFHPAIQLFFPTMELFSVNKNGEEYLKERRWKSWTRGTRETSRRQTVPTKSRKEEEAPGNARVSPRDRRWHTFETHRVYIYIVYMRRITAIAFIILAMQTTLIGMRCLLEFKGDVWRKGGKKFGWLRNLEWEKNRIFREDLSSNVFIVR